MKTNCVAVAKVVKNSRLKTLRIVFSFDQHNRITVRNAALVTGDICRIDDEDRQFYIEQAVARARDVLRTDNIQILDK